MRSKPTKNKQVKPTPTTILTLTPVPTIKKGLFLGLCSTLLSLSGAFAQASLPTSIPTNPTKAEQEIFQLSKNKWRWMTDKKVNSLGTLFNTRAAFVHTGGSWGKDQELSVIKSGTMWCKKADVYGASVNIIGNTAILLNNIDLVAVVGSNEPGRRAVVNPFMVAEVYVDEKGKWTRGSLMFSKLMRPVKTKS